MGAPKIPAKVYLVLDAGGNVMCVFASAGDAHMFIGACGKTKNGWTVDERIVHRGQPDHPGYNV